MPYEFTLIEKDKTVPIRVFSEGIATIREAIEKNELNEDCRINLIKLALSDLKKETETDAIFLKKLPAFNWVWKRFMNENIGIEQLKSLLKGYNHTLSNDPTRVFLLTSLNILANNAPIDETLQQLSKALQELENNSEKAAIHDWNRDQFFKDQLITYPDVEKPYTIQEMKNLIQSSLNKHGYTAKQANTAFHCLWQGSLLSLQELEAFLLMTPEYHQGQNICFCQAHPEVDNALNFTLTVNFPILNNKGIDTNVKRCKIIEVSIPKNIESPYPGTYNGMSVSCRTILRSESQDDLAKVVAKIAPKIDPFQYSQVADKEILDEPKTSLFDVRHYQAKKNLGYKLNLIEKLILNCSELLGLKKPTPIKHTLKIRIDSVPHVIPDITPIKPKTSEAQSKSHP